MYAEFDKVSYIDMSNSELFIIEKDPDSMKFKFLLEFTREKNASAISEDGEIHLQHQQVDQEEEKKYSKGNTAGKVVPVGELLVGDNDDDEGFRTPTSLQHKIPDQVIQQCPPAPKKPKTRPSSTKRKLSSDLFDEIELFFQPLISDLDRKIKKVRATNTNVNC